MDLPGYPEIVIADMGDAQTFVRILADNGVKVNLRNVALPEKSAGEERPATPRDRHRTQGYKIRSETPDV
jgi:hypothetical protein